MITILPLQDVSRKQEILKAFPQAGEQADVLAFCDRQEELGFAVVDLHSSVLRILRMHLSGQSLGSLDAVGKLTADSLMRACASYGANFGAYRIEIHEVELVDFFCTKGFQREGNYAAASMDTIVKIHKP